jgi:hypothetical protein
MLAIGFCLQAILEILSILFERILRKQCKSPTFVIVVFNLEEDIFFPQESPPKLSIWTCLKLEDARMPKYVAIKMISEVIRNNWRLHSSTDPTFSSFFRKFPHFNPMKSTLPVKAYLFGGHDGQKPLKTVQSFTPEAVCTAGFHKIWCNG